MAGQPRNPQQVRFGAFEFDRRNAELRRQGTALRLQPQPAKVLAVLLSRAGEVVTRQELAQQVWGAETFVDFDQGLNYAIRQIRTALEDDADHPRFLETLPKRGYRFIARLEAVEQEPETAIPELLTNGRPFDNEAVQKTRWLKWRWAALGAACTLIVAIPLVRYLLGRTPSGPLAPIRSVAVLPLVNLSADPTQEYFSDGLSDELTTELARIGNLRVISRTSANGFKSSGKRAPEIGRELHVDAIVEGTVERVGSRVRIRAQLIRAATDQHVWAESYDRDLSDVLQLERDVARDIAQQVGYRISQGEQGADRDQVPASAHEDYLKGRYHWNKRSEVGLRKGVEHFQSAIDKYPSYALAYAGLADSYVMLANWGFTAPADAYPKAKSAALKALELDSRLGEAHTSLAYTTLLYDLDWEGSERRFRQAIALNPNYASAHHFFSICLMTSGRHDEALAEIRRAQELDPLSLIINSVAGWIHYEARQYDQAIQQYLRTLEMDPNYVPALLDLGTAYMRLGDYRKAIAQFEKARAVGGDTGVVLSDLAQAHALSGNRAQALRTLREIQHHSSPVFVSPWDLSLIYVALGDKKSAIKLLEKAADEHVGWVIRLGVDPALDTLRAEPQFKDLVRKLRIPQYA